jgi:hypothetical protein
LVEISPDGVAWEQLELGSERLTLKVSASGPEAIAKLLSFRRELAKLPELVGLAWNSATLDADTGTTRQVFSASATRGRAPAPEE